MVTETLKKSDFKREGASNRPNSMIENNEKERQKWAFGTRMSSSGEVLVQEVPGLFSENSKGLVQIIVNRFSKTQKLYVSHGQEKPRSDETRSSRRSKSEMTKKLL